VPEEKLVAALRQSFNPGRSNVEQPGQTSPLGLERDLNAQFGIQLADYAPMAPGLDRPFELIRVAVTAVVAQFSVVSIMSPDGFFVEFFRNNAAQAVLIQTVAAFPALATVAGSVSRSLQERAFPRISFQTGNLAASIGTNFFMSTAIVLDTRLWIPPNRVFVTQVDTANINGDWNIGLSGVSVS